MNSRIYFFIFVVFCSVECKDEFEENYGRDEGGRSLSGVLGQEDVSVFKYLLKVSMLKYFSSRACRNFFLLPVNIYLVPYISLFASLHFFAYFFPCYL